jgi:hypothetical protein
MPNTTAFQWIFDNAENISIDRSPVTAQTMSRSNVVRTVSRGGDVWRFTVTMPNGMRWSTSRSYIENITIANRYTKGNVQMNNAGYANYLSKYQGNATTGTAVTGPTGFVANVTQGNANLTLTSSPTISTGYVFRTGDWIQLGTAGNVYAVSEDLAISSGTTVKLNRSIRDAGGSYNLTVGPGCVFQVYCTALPRWTIFGYDQISWSGSFEFYEALT